MWLKQEVKLLTKQKIYRERKGTVKMVVERLMSLTFRSNRKTIPISTGPGVKSEDSGPIVDKSTTINS